MIKKFDQDGNLIITEYFDENGETIKTEKYRKTEPYIV